MNKKGNERIENTLIQTVMGTIAMITKICFHLHFYIKKIQLKFRLILNFLSTLHSQDRRF